MNTCYSNGTTNPYGTNGTPSWNGQPFGAPNFPTNNPTNGWQSGWQNPWQSGSFCPPTNAFFPNGCQGNACPDFSGNGCCMTGTSNANGWNTPASFAWSPNGAPTAQGFQPGFQTGFPSGFQPGWNGQPWTNQFQAYASPSWNQWNPAGWSTPWNCTPNAPFAHWSNQWTNPNATPWSNQWSTPWSNQWTNQSTNAWTNQWSNPWTNSWSNSWSNPTANTWNQPTNGFGPNTSPFTSPNGQWCYVPTMTPWGLCFTTVPTAVYANLVASCAQSAVTTPWATQNAWNAPNAWSNQPTGWNTPWASQSPSPWATPWTPAVNTGWTPQANPFAGPSPTPFGQPGFTPSYGQPRTGFTPTPYGSGFTPTPNNYSNTGKPFPAVPTTGLPNGSPTTAPSSCATNATPSYGSSLGNGYGNGNGYNPNPTLNSAPTAANCGPNGTPSQYCVSANQYAPVMMPEPGCCSGANRNAA